MSICYEKLFKLLEEKGISTYYLRQNKIMGQQTYYNLKKGKGNLGTETLEKLCALLNCQPGDLMEYIPTLQEKSKKIPTIHEVSVRVPTIHEASTKAPTIQKISKKQS